MCRIVNQNKAANVCAGTPRRTEELGGAGRTDPAGEAAPMLHANETAAHWCKTGCLNTERHMYCLATSDVGDQAASFSLPFLHKREAPFQTLLCQRSCLLRPVSSCDEGPTCHKRLSSAMSVTVAFSLPFISNSAFRVEKPLPKPKLNWCGVRLQLPWNS